MRRPQNRTESVKRAHAVLSEPDSGETGLRLLFRGERRCNTRLGDVCSFRPWRATRVRYTCRDLCIASGTPAGMQSESWPVLH